MQCMEDIRRVVLRLEMAISDQRPISGRVRADHAQSLPFSGWSELFAALQQLTAEPGGITEMEEHP
jgi:hypothetical protein